jgi:hypothetical protein
MVRTQIRLPEAQYAALKRMGAARNVSMAALIRQSVDLMLRGRIEIDADERHQRALDLAGRFHSGKNDISEKHDCYLSDALSE